MFWIGLILLGIACIAFPPIFFVILALFAWWLINND